MNGFLRRSTQAQISRLMRLLDVDDFFLKNENVSPSSCSGKHFNIVFLIKFSLDIVDYLLIEGAIGKCHENNH